MSQDPEKQESQTENLRFMIEQCQNGAATFDDLHTALATFEVRNNYPLTLRSDIVAEYAPPTGYHWVTNEEMAGVWVKGYVAAESGDPESSNPYERGS